MISGIRPFTGGTSGTRCCDQINKMIHLCDNRLNILEIYWLALICVPKADEWATSSQGHPDDDATLLLLFRRSHPPMTIRALLVLPMLPAMTRH